MVFSVKDGPRAISVDRAAVVIGIGRSLAWTLVRQGKLRSVRAGYRVLVPLDAIDQFLAGVEVGV